MNSSRTSEHKTQDNVGYPHIATWLVLCLRNLSIVLHAIPLSNTSLVQQHYLDAVLEALDKATA